MCEYCTKHGEGKKWYLQMKNYSDELLNSSGRREFIKNFILEFEEKIPREINFLNKINNLPSLLKKILKNISLNRQKKLHSGQIVPIEDVEKLLDFCDSVTFLPCMCRKVTKGIEKQYCFGLSIPPADIPEEILKKYPNIPESLQIMKKEEAIKIIKKFDEQGLFHSIWTFKTPYIGGLCNCDYDCLGFKTRMLMDFPALSKGEYIAKIDWDKCKGCKNCLKQCQFGAIKFSSLENKCLVEEKLCFGCGVCRVSCTNDAITLTERIKIPSLVKEW